MYKFIVSCHYWPTADGRLRLRSFQLKTNRRKPTGLDFSQAARLTTVEQNAPPDERRRATRLKAGCDAELTTSLAILDSEAPSPDDESLVFFGRTKDLSAGGLSVILPSTLIDERYCGDLQLSLYLPKGPVKLEVNAVRCEPLRAEDAALGYLVGAQILSIDDNRDEYDQYLRSISV